MKQIIACMGCILLLVMLVPSNSSGGDCITITDITASFNPNTCKVEIEWTTNCKSSSKVYWGANCQSLTNTATGDNCVTDHFVTFTATGFDPKERVYYKVESATSCTDAEQSTCSHSTFVVIQYCPG